MRVFLVEKNPRFDVDPAKEFGELVFLKVSSSPFNTDAFMSDVKAQLEEQKFDPFKDSVALTGNALAIALFLSVCTTQYEQTRVLMFSAATNKYRERMIRHDSKVHRTS